MQQDVPSKQIQNTWAQLALNIETAISESQRLCDTAKHIRTQFALEFVNQFGDNSGSSFKSVLRQLMPHLAQNHESQMLLAFHKTKDALELAKNTNEASLLSLQQSLGLEKPYITDALKSQMILALSKAMLGTDQKPEHVQCEPMSHLIPVEKQEMAQHLQQCNELASKGCNIRHTVVLVYTSLVKEPDVNNFMDMLRCIAIMSKAQELQFERAYRTAQGMKQRARPKRKPSGKQGLANTRPPPPSVTPDEMEDKTFCRPSIRSE